MGISYRRKTVFKIRCTNPKCTGQTEASKKNCDYCEAPMRKGK